MSEQRQMIVVGVVAGVVLAAGILIGLLLGGGDDSPNQAALATLTPSATASARATGSATASPRATASAGATATATLDDAAIVEVLRSLPLQMRIKLQQQLQDGEITLKDIEEMRDDLNNARSATVLEASDDAVKAVTFLGEQFTTEITEDTVVRRGNQEIAASDLKEDEIILVFSEDGGLTALAIQAFGVLGSDLR